VAEFLHAPTIAHPDAIDQTSPAMGAVFANVPIRAACVEVQVLRISFDAPCRYCRRPASAKGIEVSTWPPT
jgi:hypothetical protein